jgi:pimeloyl-ACP methyl ester carboxylesterase
MTAVDLHAATHGEGTPPLVLLHGYTASGLDWADVHAPLAVRRQVITYDHRGHGQSPKLGNEASYAFDLLLEDVVAALERRGGQPVHVLGHSMGGIIALRLAMERPDLVQSLFVSSTGPESTGAIPVVLLRVLTLMGRALGMSTAHKVVTMLRGRGKPQQGTPMRRAELEARSARSVSQMDPHAFLALGLELNTYPSLRSGLQTLAIPTTFMVGVNDTGLREAAEIMAAAVPGARLVVVPDAGHNPHQDQPKAWLQAVEEHLDRSG